MKTKMNKIIEVIFHILENEKGYLDAKMTPEVIYADTGIKPDVLEKTLKEYFGMTTYTLLSMYRLQHASGLLRRGVLYEDTYGPSGFESMDSMVQAIDSIAV